MNVWTYWAGPRPWWIDRCLKRMEVVCGRSRKSEFVLLTPECVKVFIEGPFNDRWRTLPPGVGTDALRAYLLAKHGGLWLDADTVLLKNPASLLDHYDHRQFLYSVWTKEPWRVVAGYVYSCGRNPVAELWLAWVEAALRHAEGIGWGDIGERMVGPAIKMCPGSTTSWQVPLRTFVPLDFDADPGALFSEDHYNQYVGRDVIGFGLNHSWMMAHRADLLTEEAVASGNLLVQRLLRECL